MARGTAQALVCMLVCVLVCATASAYLVYDLQCVRVQRQRVAVGERKKLCKKHMKYSR